MDSIYSFWIWFVGDGYSPLGVFAVFIQIGIVGVAFWYALETRKMRMQNDRLLKAGREQYEFAMRQYEHSLQQHRLKIAPKLTVFLPETVTRPEYDYIFSLNIENLDPASPSFDVRCFVVGENEFYCSYTKRSINIKPLETITLSFRESSEASYEEFLYKYGMEDVDLGVEAVGRKAFIMVGFFDYEGNPGVMCRKVMLDQQRIPAGLLEEFTLTPAVI